MVSDAELFTCKFCNNTSRSIISHLLHSRHHRNVTKYWHCGYQKCKSMLPSEGSLRAHVIRCHKVYVNKPRVSMLKKISNLSNRNAKFECSLAACSQQFFEQRHLMNHLKSHLTSGIAVNCPFSECIKKFTSWHSLTGHISKSHRQENVPNDELLCSEEMDHYNEELDLQLGEFAALSENMETETMPEIMDPSLVALAQFYQKLEYKHLIPESTVQLISKELTLLLKDSQDKFLNNLKVALGKDNEIPPLKKSEVICSVSGECGISQMCHKLRSTHIRKKFFKEQFNFVEPEIVPLEDDKFFYYVSIEDTLKAAFKNKSWTIDFNTSHVRGGVLRDFTDGEVFLKNEFFKQHPNALRLILYQDGFELVCPIGPAKSLKHKIQGVYMALGNLPSNVRFQKDSIQLVALVRECDFDHEKVYGKIVDEIRKIQVSGIQIPTVGNVTAGVAFIAGDNLGSHQLGGFAENFSKSTYFCRYCLLRRPLFTKNGGESRKFKPRTKQSYINALQNVRVHPVTKKIKGCEGIKFNSEFNQIAGFHVCSPGLPACLGHDLMEGVVAHDLKLFIRYFVEEEWFSLKELNHMVECFPYSSEDKQDKPVIIKSIDKEKLAGGAWQVWTYLRLFPLIVFGRVKDFDDPVWKCLLQLRAIVLTAVAPEIHVSQLASFQYIIDEYLITRKELFPLKPLRPKHHYMSHYPELILAFGPLIKVWTLRFESKHTFFKRAWKSCNNSINILKSMSFKHEFLQSWVRCGASEKSVSEMGSVTQFLQALYSDKIVTAVHQSLSVRNLQECSSIKIKGTLYSKGSAVILKELHNGVLYLGIIHLILLDSKENVKFLVKDGKAFMEPHTGSYKVIVQDNYECVGPDELLSYYPHHIYTRDTGMYISLKHALVSVALEIY